MQPLRSVGRSNFDKGRHNLTTLIQKSTYINECCYIIYIYKERGRDKCFKSSNTHNRWWLDNTIKFECNITYDLLYVHIYPRSVSRIYMHIPGVYILISVTPFNISDDKQMYE